MIMHRRQRASLLGRWLILAIVLAPAAGMCQGQGFVPAPRAGADDARFAISCGDLRCAFEADGILFCQLGPAPLQPAADHSSPSLPDRVLTRSDPVGPGRSGHVLRLSFLDINPQARLRGRGASPGHTSRYRGRRDGAWRDQQQAFDEVVYEALWPGVDLVIRQGLRGLRYEFQTADSAALGQVRYRWDGGTGNGVAEDGAETVTTSLGALVASPRLGTTLRGVIGLVPAKSESPASLPPTAVRAQLDPDVVWSTYMGGWDYDRARGVVADAQGRLFVVGESTSDDFPTTPGVFQEDHHQLEDVILVAWDGQSGHPLWSTYMGGDNLEEGWAICLSAAGNPIIAGRTWSTDFPTTPGVLDSLRNGPEAAFVAELDAATGQLIWSTLLECAFATGVAIDTTGEVVIAGNSYYGGLPTTLGAYDETYNGDMFDGMLARISEQGRRLDWCTYLGSPALEFIYGIALDRDDRPVVSGYARGSETCQATFPVTTGAYDVTYNCATDGFVAKLSADGGQLAWSTYLGGASIDFLLAVALDGNDNVVVGGGSESTTYPTTAGAFQVIKRGMSNAIISKLSSDGSSLLWSTYLGGEDWVTCFGLHLDTHGRVIVAGTTDGPTFPGPAGPDELSTAGEKDGFVSVLRADGSRLVDSHVLGGSISEEYVQVCSGPSGETLLAGRTYSLDFPVTAGCYQDTMNGWPDLFVLKLSAAPTAVFLQRFEASRVNQGATITWELTGSGDPALLRLWREAGVGSRTLLEQRQRVSQGGAEFVDRSAPPEAVSYWLAIVEAGQSNWYGPAVLPAAALPERLAITSSAPNPFNPRTAIRYSLPQATRVTLAVYDQRGRLVRTLVDEALPAGEHAVEWDGRDTHGALAASGTYIVRLVTEQGVRTSKITLAK